MPLMTIDEAVAIFISSQTDKPSSENDQFETIVDRDGEPVFSFTRISLVCDACKAKGVMQASDCPHNQHQRPKHQSEQKQRKLEAIYNLHSKITHARENLGMSIEDNANYFEHKLLEYVFNGQTPKTLKSTWIPEVYLSVDPCGGTLNPTMPGKSEYAMISAVPIGMHMVIVGIDAIHTSRATDVAPNFVQHIKKLRALPGAANATVHIIFENNSNIDADWLDDYARRSGIGDVNWIGDPLLKRGVQTTHPVKREMAILTREMMKTNLFMFADQTQLFTTMDKDELGNPTNALAQKAKMHDQLKRYAEKRTPSADPTKPVKVEFTGKMNGQPDDLAVCVQLLMYWSNKFNANRRR